MRALIIILLSSLVLFGCGAEPGEVAPVEKIFDPRVPGGTTSANPRTQDILGLSAEVEYNRVTLRWVNPSIYIGQSYKIHVYRIEGDGEGFTLPDPGAMGSSAFLYYPRIDFQPFNDILYVDQNTENLFNLIPNKTYTYFVLVEKGDLFSSGKTITVSIPEAETQIDLPAPSSFWKNYASRTGGRPNPDFGTIFMETLDAGAPSLTSSNGQIAWAKEGTIQYISDTDNNRVMIYVNRLGLSCYEDNTEGSLEFDICIAVNGMAPLQPYAVLGQASFGSSFNCQDAANPLDDAQCLTRPTGVLVKDDKLVISDNGNDRVKIYDYLPKYGCYNFENMLGDTTPPECTPSRVIGKQGISDLTNYSLATDGDSALSCPNGLEAQGDNLYIADTCNHRVVIARNALNPSLFECSPGSWQTSSCVFAGQIGQPDLFSNENFEDEWDADNFSYDYVSDILIGDQTFLRRHIRYPNVVKIHDGKMFIAGNENFSKVTPFGDLTLYSRIMRFDDLVLEGSFPLCTNITYSVGGCDASWVYGQQGYNKIPMTPFGGNYTDNTYTFKQIGGLDLFGEMLFVTDASDNIVSIWQNAFENTTLGSPPTLRITDPAGVFDADNNRSQPDLAGLGGIYFRQNQKGLIVFDSGGNHYYLIQIYETNVSN